MRCSVVGVLASVGLLVLAACDARSNAAPPAAKLAPQSTVSAEPAATATAGEGALRLGAPIEASTQRVTLADVAKRPGDFIGKTFATSGTVTEVCQRRGCWMEIRDEASDARIKMAGHAFFVPRTASGRKAHVLAKLDKDDSACAGEGHGHEGIAAAHAGEKKGCCAASEEQPGHPLARLELVAEGVELM